MYVNMLLLNACVLLLTLAVDVILGQTSELCLSPQKFQGTCVNVKDCPAVVFLLDQARRSASLRNYLRSTMCDYSGSVVKVCCVHSETSDDILAQAQLTTTTTTTDTSPQNSVLFPHNTVTSTLLRPPSQDLEVVPLRTEPSVDINSIRMVQEDSVYSTTKKSSIPNHDLPDRNILLPTAPNCGYTDRSDRIYGGQAVELDEFPWLALLQYRTPKGLGFHCTGSLISERYVLTAGHCVQGGAIPKNYELINVRLGEYDTTQDIDCVVIDDNGKDCNESPLDVAVEEQIIHEGYASINNNHLHDIALLRLAEPVKFNTWIKPICLPKYDALGETNYTNMQLTVSGWGQTEIGKKSNVKLKVDVPVVSLLNCSILYQKLKIDLWQHQICAGGVFDQDSCKGDSGAPLMKLEPSSFRMYIVGLVSFGTKNCGQIGWPGVYTRVSSYTNWIASKIRP